jgi:hypothetical protein
MQVSSNKMNMRKMIKKKISAAKGSIRYRTEWVNHFIPSSIVQISHMKLKLTDYGGLLLRPSCVNENTTDLQRKTKGEVFTEAAGSMIPACGSPGRCRRAGSEEHRSCELALRKTCGETAGRRALMEKTRREG